MLIAIVVGVVSVPTLRRLALPLALSGAAATGYAALFALRATHSPPDQEIERGRAFDLRTAPLLAGVVSIVLLVSGVINAEFGRTGVVFGTAVAGFADSQSAAISAATLASEGQVTTSTAVVAILAALSTNTVSKAVIAATLGKRRYAAEVWPGLALTLAAAWGGWAIASSFEQAPGKKRAAYASATRAGAIHV